MEVDSILPQFITAQQAQKIKPINRATVHQICSGQVVLNLATAVKELVENSLDAGATVIDIRLKEHGSELIEVTDNGCGVEEHNFQALTLKHHTSKLQDFSDLVSVETFGFRGEALSSLCALSEVSVITRHESANCGTKLDFDHNGKIISQKSQPRQVGTTVSLQKIFCSLPVRQKEFHRNIKREFAKMTQILYAYCLVATGVKISCINVNSKGSRTTIVSTQGSKSVRDNISCIFGTKQLNSLMEFAQETPGEDLLEEIGLSKQAALGDNPFHLEGYVSSCSHGQGRAATDRQFFYVNSRPCDPPKIVKMVNDTYHQFNSHQYPFVYIDIKTVRTSVDVNVTPDKRQIFLENEKLLLCTLKASLLHLYKNVPSTFQFQNTPVPSNSVSVTSPPSSVSTTHLGNLFRQWSRSPESSSTNRGTKRNFDAFKTGQKNRPSKQLSVQSYFTSKSNSEPQVDQSCEKSNFDTSCSDDVVNCEVFSNDAVEYKCDMFNEVIDDISCASSSKTRKSETDIIHNGEILETCVEFNNKTSVTDRIKNLTNSSVMDEVIVDNTVHLTENSVEVNESESCTTRDVTDEVCILACGSDSYSESLDKDSAYESSQSCELGVEKSESEIAKVDLGKPESLERKCARVRVSLKHIQARLEQRKSRKSKSESEKQMEVKFHAEIDPSKNSVAEDELRKEISKEMFSQMKIIGQFNLGFIVTRLGPDLFIIDQHATDEKYNFETLQKSTTIQNQKLVIPQTLELTAVNESILTENIEVFQKNGFDLSINEEGEPTKRVQLIAIPMSKNWHFGKEDIDELLFMLQDSPHTMCRPSRVRAMFASRACRKSVMIGTPLSHAEMRKLVNHMGEIDQPWNCPHGRPTMRHLINLRLIKSL